MIDIPKIYNEYLQKKSVENREKYKDHLGWFSASSAGSCYRKQIHRTQGLEVGALDEKSARLLRLGTLVHADFEEAMKDYDIQERADKPDELQVVTEHRIEIPELNVVGHLDVGVINREGEMIHVYDIKTAGAWKWRMKFGRNPDKNPSVNYELQLATYAIGLGNEEDITDIRLSIMWYNKDNSMMREEKISDLYLEEAFNYWTDLNETSDSIQGEAEMLKPGTENVPVYNWECKYCEFQGKYCPGLYSI
tara:strand:- start:284 stop:1033 length:750 start_codon:yes stop_codon:yes gene_type:complete